MAHYEVLFLLTKSRNTVKTVKRFFCGQRNYWIFSETPSLKWANREPSRHPFSGQKKRGAEKREITFEHKTPSTNPPMPQNT
jgi:hypothetical protein